MFRSRGFITFVIVALIIAAAYFLLLREGATLSRLRQPPEELPLYLVNVIPQDWKIVPGQARECNFDDDADKEWFVVYRYDSTEVPAPGQAAGTTISRGPIGAAIFDRQTNVIPEGSGNPSLYRSTLLVPYRLLPDFYAGKGQGYLGEAGAADLIAVKTIFHGPKATAAECAVDEITILGYADSALPTRLSIFRWTGDQTGFRAAHFVGNARIDTEIPQDGSQTIQAVTTYNRLDNHRSLLCESRTYGRTGAADALLFEEKPTAYTVDFCFGASPDPYHPEGVVVALLRGSQPGTRTASTTGTPTASVKSVPPTNGFLMNNAVPASDLFLGAAQKVQIFSVTNPAGVDTDPAGGRTCTAEEITIASAEAPKWICGRESAVIETAIVIDGVVRRAVWQLISIVPDQIDSDVHWRIQRVDLP